MELILLFFLSSLVPLSICTTYYYSNTDQRSWDNAQSDCVSRGMKLASLYSQAKFDEAKAYVQSIRNPPPYDIWIGLRLDESLPAYTYRWSDGSLLSYSFWSSGEPNSQASDKCNRMDKSSWAWKTWSCSSSYSYLCEVLEPTTPAPTTPAPTTPAPTTPVPTTQEPTTADDIREVTGSLDDYWSWDEAMAQTGYMGLAFGFGFAFFAVLGICLLWFCCCIRKQRLEKEEEMKKFEEKQKRLKAKQEQQAKQVYTVGENLRYVPQTQEVLFS